MRYKEILQKIPGHVRLVVVAKNRSWEEAQPVYDAGCRDFGENRVQEALGKMKEAPPDVRWHLIGTLQKNKVAKAVGRFFLIHSVDTPELAEKISACAERQGSVQPILLQVNTSDEESKQGLSAEAWERAFPSLLNLPGIALRGLMTMAPLTDDEALIRGCFSRLRQLRDKLGLSELSMGMSQDYAIALEEGATLLRIGTAVFEKER